MPRDWEDHGLSTALGAGDAQQSARLTKAFNAIKLKLSTLS